MEGDNRILVFDDSEDIGKEPLPIRDSEGQKVHDALLEKYKNKQKALCRQWQGAFLMQFNNRY